MTNPNNAAQAAAQILTYLGFAQAVSMEPAADPRRDHIQALIESALLSKLRVPVSDIRKGFELTYAADADDPACASDLRHFTNGWRACIMSQVRAPVADERAAQGYGSPADVAQRIEQYLYHDGRTNSATHLLYEAMKALRNSTLLPVSVDIRRMAERIAADKFEHYTADPIFTVQRRRVWAGFDLVYEPKIGWFCDGEQVTGAERDALEAEYQESGKVPSDRTRTGIMEMWEHHATYMTMEAAQEFVAKKGDEYRVYVDSGCRNHEWQALRAFLLQIAALQGKGGEA